MNYYNPYFYTMPTTLAAPKVGIFSRLFGGSGITLGGILNGTQRALNFANQAIPLVKQVKPMVGNAKTMFKVMNEFKRVETPNKVNKKDNIYTSTSNDIKENISTNINSNDNNVDITNEVIKNDDGPTFFI